MAAIDISALNVGLSTLVDPAQRPAAGAVLQDAYDIDSPWHHHDMHQIQYAFEGSIELEDRSGRHLLPRNIAGWIPAGVEHRNSVHRVRSVSILLARDMVADAGDRVRVIKVSPLMRAMMAEACRWSIFAPQDETGRAFYIAFGRLCGEWIADEAPFTLPSSTDAQVAAAMAYTRSNLARSSLPQAAAAAGLSERTLRRRFLGELGMGWDDYRRRARLIAAVEALSDSARSVAQIAAEVGFESQSAFAKAFQQLTGETPREFRRRRS
ncbi:MAG: helix-turn-helix transcriptional regulator [Novosphingobium sp.]